MSCSSITEEEGRSQVKMEKDYCITQLVDGDGVFNDAGIDIFTDDVNFAASGKSYAIVAIMGPQSSGKSTLMNHLFGTKFTEMEAADGPKQTTLGIWIAKCVGIEPFTIAVDLEGSDGKERAKESKKLQDDTTFEKQIALFGLAISDILLINMGWKDVGRENAASKPLLRTVFQVMMSLFGPGRKKTLVFVIRDRHQDTPFDKLKADILKDINEIWKEVPKPQKHESTHLSQCFQVEVVALPNYEYRKEEFKEEVAKLKERFSNSICPGGLAGCDRENVVPASVFSVSSKHIWKQIKDNKDLNLPSINVMVATVRCDEIAKEIFNQFTTNQDWLQLEQAVNTGTLTGLGKTGRSILEFCFEQYEMQTTYFDQTVKIRKRQDVLEKSVIEFMRPAYTIVIKNIGAKALEDFKVKLKQAINDNTVDIDAYVCTLTQSSMTEFDQGCADAVIKQDVDWEVSSTRNKLLADIKAHADYETTIERLKREKLQNEKEAKKKLEETTSRLQMEANEKLEETTSRLQLEANEKMEETTRRLHMEANEKLEETTRRLHKEAKEKLEENTRRLNMEATVMQHSPENIKAVASSWYGGRGGAHWDDGKYDGVIELHITYDTSINSFAATYALGGQVIKPGMHGGRGVNSITIPLDYPREFLISISGDGGKSSWSGNFDVIKSLKLKTNVKTYGPFGSHKGPHFSFSIPKGHKVRGFHGRSGDLLDSIGFHSSMETPQERTENVSQESILSK